MKDYISGYCAKMQSIRPGGSGQNCGYRYNQQSVPVILGFGVNNCIGGQNCANPPGLSSNAVTYEHGRAWGTTINNLTTFVTNQGYSYQIFIAGAMDIEGAWNTYTNTKAWLDGYKSVTNNTFYNYGNCDCPDGYQPWAPFPRDWSYDRIHEVSCRGLPVKYPLPQIYHAQPYGIDARRWQGLSKWAVINGYSRMIFRELLTQSRACSQTQRCSGPGWAIDNKPGDAITQMREALDTDPQTANSLYFYLRSTDINWYPRP